MKNKLGQEPAFPTEVTRVNPIAGIEYTEMAQGMSTRLYVATALMQGIITGGIIYEPQLLAEKCCEYADALLEQELKTRTNERQD